MKLNNNSSWVCSNCKLDIGRIYENYVYGQGEWIHDFDVSYTLDQLLSENPPEETDMYVTYVTEVEWISKNNIDLYSYKVLQSEPIKEVRRIYKISKL